MAETLAHVSHHLPNILQTAQSDVEKFMKECGVSVDKESIKVFFKQIEGKDIVTLTKEGKAKLISMPACGGGGAPAVAGKTAVEAVEEEKKEEPEDVDMGGLFGGDDEEY